MTLKPILGAIEAGGTKFLCGIADADGQLLDLLRIPTADPDETLGSAANFFRDGAQQFGDLATLSIGSFGPLCLNTSKPNFGTITTTPKAGWQNVNLVERFRRTIGGPVLLDTDVNCAAVGEWLLGSGRGMRTLCYITVGTGIGVGLLINGVPHGGANHPEGGHVRLPRAAGDEHFAGICPFHGDCVEGLASGPAMQARWGIAPDALPQDHRGWTFEADYLAGLCATLTYTVRPDRIVLGGGVAANGMHLRVRDALRAKLAGYDASLAVVEMDEYVAVPTAGLSPGLTGAFALAHHAVIGRWPEHWTVQAMFPRQESREIANG